MLSTTLRRVLVASGFVVATSFMSSAAFAATTGDVIIGGSVASTLTMGITAKAGAATINLAPAQTNAVLEVADITMGTNNSTGLSLKLDAASSFSMANTGGGTPVAFTVAAVEGDLETGAVYKGAVGDVLITSTAAQASTTAYSLFIKYSTQATFQDPGTYSSTIKLIVSDN